MLIERLGFKKAEPREPERISLPGALILTVAFLAVGYILIVLAFCIGGTH